MKNANIIILSLIMTFIAGCAGSKPPGQGSLFSQASSEIVDNIPDWFSNPEPIENTILANGEGVSNSKRGSTSKAKQAVKADFQSKAKSIVSGRTEDFFKETGEGADSEVYAAFEEITTSVMEGAVENWFEIKSTTVVEKSVKKDGTPYNVYRHYILAGIDQAAADRQLLAKLKREKELMTAFEQTKSYDKLLADLDRYKDKL